jgi:hypothetical protein
MSEIILRPGPSQTLPTQTLASFGRYSICCGMAVDRAGNIYVAVRLHPDQPQVLLLMLKPDGNRAVLLAVRDSPVGADDSPNAITITPSGQHWVLVQSDGKVLKYSAPFQDAQPQQVGQIEPDWWYLENDDQT